jgi:GT2 family glycosyltransferase
VGSVDAALIAGHERVHLQDAEGYTQARLLVRDASQVRGFVDVEVTDGFVDPATLVREIDSLPECAPRTGTIRLPHVTVVICTRDRASHLRGALKAAVELDYPHFDVVVVDNASRTTETADLVRNEFAMPSVTLISEPVPGLSNARNRGLNAASGEIVAFTDDDVIVDPHWLTELAAGFDRVPGVDCVAGLVPSGELRTRTQGYFDGRVSWSKNLAPRVFSLETPPADLPMFPFSIGEFGTGANFALRRTAALSLGGFDTALGVGTRTGGGEDIDMFTRVLLDGRTLVTQPSAVVWHRHRDDLAALRVQARGYGTGLGAWLTKLAMNPRTARMAFVRSPHAVGRLISLAWRKPAPSAVARVETPDEWDREVSRVGWLELFAVARGPASYLLQRRSDKKRLRALREQPIPE